MQLEDLKSEYDKLQIKYRENIWNIYESLKNIGISYISLNRKNKVWKK